jgi:hypothetical protein
MTRCDLCWAGLALWVYLYTDPGHADAMQDMTMSLASLMPVCVCGSMVPAWGGDPADLLGRIHEMAHRMVERYAPILLECAALACREAREAGDAPRARGLQRNIDLLELARASYRG